MTNCGTFQANSIHALLQIKAFALEIFASIAILSTLRSMLSLRRNKWSSRLKANLTVLYWFGRMHLMWVYTKKNHFFSVCLSELRIKNWSPEEITTTRHRHGWLCFHALQWCVFDLFCCLFILARLLKLTNCTADRSEKRCPESGPQKCCIFCVYFEQTPPQIAHT